MNFLQPGRELKRYTLLAVDGEIGSIEEVYFDDSSWGVRYLVVNTGNWLTGRQVLISPVAVGDVKEDNKLIHIELTREQIRNSPPRDTHKPVSRRYEMEYFKYYAWPPYWETETLSRTLPPSRATAVPAAITDTAKPGSEALHLRSTTEVKGYEIAARDGEIGHVEDFIIDPQYWVIRYLEIGTRNWWPGKHVLVNPSWIERVSWGERTVDIDLTRDVIKRAPAFDPARVIDRDYEVQLFKHYGRRVYWGQVAKTT
jgi:uncharacterized protein YrrD